MRRPDLSIRSATPADRQFLFDLAARLADFDLPPGRTAEEISGGDRQALLKALDGPEPGTGLFVAELGGVRAGCLLMWTLVDYFTRQPHAHVSVLAVTREAEGRGVGGALMQQAEAWAASHGHRVITLSVFEQNRRAQALYERLGFASEVRRYVKRL